MGIQRKIRLAIEDALDIYIGYLKRKSETHKFEDKRRVEIYSKIELTDEQRKAIDKLYKKHYGKKIPYTWHRHYTAYTGKFDAEYIPELLYIPEFERFMNLEPEYATVFSDKNVIYSLAKGIGINTPKAHLASVRGVMQDGTHTMITRARAKEILHDIGEVFAKPTIGTCSGVGCQVLDIQNGIDVRSGKSIDDIFELLGNDFIIQERLRCHEQITKLYSHSVNTFRVISYRWGDEIRTMPVFMRMGQNGSYLDNAHAGGMFIAVNNDGTLHEKAFTEFKLEFEEHPDTGVRFSGYKIDAFPKVVECAKKMHANISQLGCINWDFTIDECGEPVLIEANTGGGSIWMVEMSHGHGCFSNTAEVLEWMKVMRKLPKSKRASHAFGKID